MRKIDADYFIEFLKGMYKRAGWNDRDIHMSLRDVISNLDNVPTITDSCQWTPVKEGLPVLTDDEDNEFLVTMRTTQSTKKFSLYYVCTAKYSENLHKLSSDDFPEENHSGWYNYDAEGGYFYNMEFKLDKYKREVVAWMPLPAPYKENK